MKTKSLNIEYIILTLMLLSVSIPRFNHSVYPHHIGILTLQVLTIILAFVLILKKKYKFSLPSFFVIASIILLFGNLFGLINTRGYGTAFLALVNKISAFVLIVSVGAVIKDDQEKFKRVFPLITTIAVVALFFSSIPGLIIDGGKPFTVSQLGHSNILAYFIIGLIPYTFCLYQNVKSKFLIPIIDVIIALATILLISTRSVAAITSLMLVWTWVLFNRIRHENKIISGIVTVMFLLVLVLSVTAMTSTGEVSSEGRSDAIHAAWQLFKNSPIIGHGPGQFLFDYPAFRSPDLRVFVAMSAREPLDHVHFEPLNSLYEGGILSGIGITVIALIVIVNSIRITLNSKQNHFDTVVAASALSLLLHSMLTLAPSREGWLPLALSIGALFAISEKSKNVIIHRNLVIALSILILTATIPAVKRIKSDYLFEKGRDWDQFWGVKNIHYLEQSVFEWPEHISARTLLAWGLYQKSKKYSEIDKNQKTELLNRALYEYETVHKLAPGFLKDNLHRARVLVERKQYSEALELLDRMPERQDSTERVELQRFIREHITDTGDLHH